MKFIQKSKLELGDTLVPDLFILNNMKSLQANDIKIYLYLLYALKKDQEIESDDIIKELNMTNEDFKTSIEVLIAEELISKSSKGYVVIDLKEAEINKSYAPKFEKQTKRTQPGVEERRKACVDAISESFFDGLLTLNWYTNIGKLFNLYGFSEEVMIALFQCCKERNALNTKYMFTVAEDWHNGNVVTFEDLENHLEKSDKMNKTKQKISKSLGYRRNLTKYEEAYVKKWIDDFGYEYDVIEEGLKRSASTTNPSIKYIDAIITSWNKKGFKTLDEVLEGEAPKIEAQTITQPVKRVISEPKKKSFQSYSQREYDSDDDFYDDI